MTRVVLTRSEFDRELCRLADEISLGGITPERLLVALAQVGLDTYNARRAQRSNAPQSERAA